MTSSSFPKFNFDNSFAREMEGFYAPWKAAIVPKPTLLYVNEELAQELGFTLAQSDDDDLAMIFSGNLAPDGASPLAFAYAGHQFGGFSPQLGDGRALLLGEVVDKNGQRRDIQLKGSGPTPFSRNGDGKAAIGPVLREYLLSEAMYVLGVPTTRALAAVSTGENVRREIPLPGAVITRVAASHIRVGTFEFFAARREDAQVKQLADYVIARHYPALKTDKTPYLGLLQAVVDAQAKLIAHWMSIGFIHGVMNTDNVTVSGQTIDYGPCAFMDHYDPETFFSSVDVQGRYAYKNQPEMGQWNLTRFAETLLPLVDDDKDTAQSLLSVELDKFPTVFFDYWIKFMATKIGLSEVKKGDMALVNDLLAAMKGQNADFTLVFRRLSQAVFGDEVALRALFDDPTKLDVWLVNWRTRLQDEDNNAQQQAEMMDQTNPLYIARNHKVEEALKAATQHQDYAPFKRLLKVLSAPYQEVAGFEAYATPAPKDARPYKTFCGT